MGFFCLPSPIRPDWEFRTSESWGKNWDTSKERRPSTPFLELRVPMAKFRRTVLMTETRSKVDLSRKTLS
jgi:hypothetical protein